MNRTLHEADNAQRILKLTADTMLLVDRNGNIVGDPLLGGFALILIFIAIYGFYKKRGS